MVNNKVVQSEKGLRVQIKRNLNKEIHPATKPSIDFIHKILTDAYESGMVYDVTDMRNAVLAFAANSTNQAEYCIKLVNKMPFKSADAAPAAKNETAYLVFYDVEVFPNLFLVNWKFAGSAQPVVRMINPTSEDIEGLMKFRLIGFNCRRYDNHKKKYQGFDDETGHHGGASTLLSRRKQDVEVPERQGSGVIDPLTGKVVYKESGRTYVDPRTGKTVAATTKVKRILAVDDVRSMSSGTLQEEAYADYANKMKDLANKARLEYKATPTLKRSASAAKAFEPEVNRLMAALKVAQLNAPLEREAQRIANARVKAKVQANNITDKDEISKIRRAAISDARNSTGASGKRTRITISDGEWTAIQSGAISDTTLSEILRYAEPKTVRERATPRRTTQLSDARISRIKAMANSGHTNAEIAEALGISTSAVSKYLNS